MRFRCRFLVACWLALIAADVHAGWLVESPDEVMERHRNEAQQIGLATFHNVRQLSQDEVHQVYGSGFMSDRPGFALRVKFREILRGKPSEMPLEVPFAFISGPHDFIYSMTNKQREAFLEEHKAVVIVYLDSSPKQPVFINVWLLSSFDTDETAKFWRKVTALWNTPNPADRRSLLKAGCADAMPEFQEYCCRRLANWRDAKQNQNAAEQLERLAALPVIWNRYLDPETPRHVLATCDEILGQMSPGWRTHPTRYDVLSAAMRQHSRLPLPPDDLQRDFNLFLKNLSAVSHFPGREREAYQLFDEVIRSAPKRYGPTALSHLSYLYRPYAQDADQQRLNQEIWDRLVAASAKPDTAESAASAIYKIARDYAYVGSLPSHVSQAIAAPPDELPRSVASSISNSFDRLRKELPEISLAAPAVEKLRQEGYQNLTVPTRSQLDKKVVFVASPGQSHGGQDPIFGHAAWSSWCSWNDEPVWIEKPADWPNGGTGLMVVTGTLAERHDVPVFKLEADANAPFQAGLPVPDGYDANEIRQRYVLVDVRWQQVDTPPAAAENP